MLNITRNDDGSIEIEDVSIDKENGTAMGYSRIICEDDPEYKVYIKLLNKKGER